MLCCWYVWSKAHIQRLWSPVVHNNQVFNELHKEAQRHGVLSMCISLMCLQHIQTTAVTTFKDTQSNGGEGCLKGRNVSVSLGLSDC